MIKFANIDNEKGKIMRRFFYSVISVFILTGSLSAFAQTGSVSSATQFLYKDFIKGVVLMKNGDKYSSSLNYNMVDEEMIFNKNGTYMTFEKPEDVDTIFIYKQKFVNIEDVYFEVIVNKPVAFFIQHKSKYASEGTTTAYGMTSQTNARTNITSLKAGNRIRTLEMPDDVKVVPEPVYWVREGNELKKFKTQKQFLKLFPSKEAELKEFIKSNNGSFDSFDFIAKLGFYYNELSGSR